MKLRIICKNDSNACSQFKISNLSEVNFGTSFSLAISVQHLVAMRAKAVEIIVSEKTMVEIDLFFDILYDIKSYD